MKKYVFSARLLVGMLAVFLLIRVWFFGSFIDEQENITAGWLISQGLVPYRDFFLHHTPLPFFLSFLLFLIGPPAEWLWRLVTLLFVLGTGLAIWRLADQRMRWPLVIFSVLFALMTPQLNLQMFLADTFFAGLFLAGTIISVSYWQWGKPDFSAAFRWLLVLLFLSGWSTIVAVPPFAVLIALIVQKEIRNSGWQQVRQRLLRPVQWFAASCGIFPVYFLASGAWKEFWWSVLTYNQQIYFPVRLAGTAAERQYGAFYAAFSRFFFFLSETGRLVVQTGLSFLMTFRGIAVQAGSVSVEQLGELIKVWLFSPIDVLSAEVWRVLGLGWWVVTVVLIGRQKWSQLSIFLIITALLFLRNNEIFHLSVLFLTVFWTVVFLGLEAVRQGRWLTVFVLGFAVLAASVHFGWSYQEHLRNAHSLISVQQQQTARQLREQPDSGKTLQVIGGGITYYWLTERLPVTTLVIYYPWFQPAEALRSDLLKALADQRADTVLLEENFDEEVVKTLKTYYSETVPGIYRPR